MIDERLSAGLATAREPLAEVNRLRSVITELEGKLNAPELHDFSKAVALEAAHQRQRWGTEHDDGKAPEDWFWILGYLAGKALHAAKSGDRDKALHHTISSAAALANWHAALLGVSTEMRPGIDPSEKYAQLIDRSPRTTRPSAAYFSRIEKGICCNCLKKHGDGRCCFAHGCSDCGKIADRCGPMSDMHESGCVRLTPTEPEPVVFQHEPSYPSSCIGGVCCTCHKAHGDESCCAHPKNLLELAMAEKRTGSK